MSSLSPWLCTGASLVRSVRKMCPPRMIDWYASYTFTCSPRRTRMRDKMLPGVAMPCPAAPPIATATSTVRTVRASCYRLPPLPAQVAPMYHGRADAQAPSGLEEYDGATEGDPSHE